MDQMLLYFQAQDKVKEKSKVAGWNDRCCRRSSSFPLTASIFYSSPSPILFPEIISSSGCPSHMTDGSCLFDIFQTPWDKFAHKDSRLMDMETVF